MGTCCFWHRNMAEDAPDFNREVADFGIVHHVRTLTHAGQAG